VLRTVAASQAVGLRDGRLLDGGDSRHGSDEVTFVADDGTTGMIALP
jgi:hypothetical protein